LVSSPTAGHLRHRQAAALGKQAVVALADVAAAAADSGFAAAAVAAGG